MKKIDFELEGGDELQDLLNEAVKKAPNATQKVIHNMGEKGVKLAKGYAPRDTGYLIDHISSKPFNLGTEIKSTAHYSGYVDKGTRYMRAQPFFTPMWEEITQDIEKPLRKAIEGVLR